MRISDWSSDVCSSDLTDFSAKVHDATAQPADLERLSRFQIVQHGGLHGRRQGIYEPHSVLSVVWRQRYPTRPADNHRLLYDLVKQVARFRRLANHPDRHASERSEEHTSELQSLLRRSYAVVCLNKQTITRP